MNAAVIAFSRTDTHGRATTASDPRFGASVITRKSFSAELIVREQLEALLNADLDDEEAVRRWKKIKELAPGLWEKSGARSIMESLATTYIRTHVGI